MRPGPGPGHKPGRATGSRASGLRYERQLGPDLPPQAKHGPWLEYLDSSGLHWCQPDYLWMQPPAVVFECKLSWTMVGHLQIEELYAPIVEHLWKVPVLGIVVSRHLTKDTPRDWICPDLESALARAGTGKRTVWHRL